MLPQTKFHYYVLDVATIYVGYALAFILSPICFVAIKALERRGAERYNSELALLKADGEARLLEAEKRHQAALEEFTVAARDLAKIMERSEAMGMLREELGEHIERGLASGESFELSLGLDSISTPYGHIRFDRKHGYNYFHSELELAAAAMCIYSWLPEGEDAPKIETKIEFYSKITLTITPRSTSGAEEA